MTASSTAHGRGGDELGAYDYLTKPTRIEELTCSCARRRRRGTRARQRRPAVTGARSGAVRRHRDADARACRGLRIVERAPTDSTVLNPRESGREGARGARDPRSLAPANRPFVPLHCARCRASIRVRCSATIGRVHGARISSRPCRARGRRHALHWTRSARSSRRAGEALRSARPLLFSCGGTRARRVDVRIVARRTAISRKAMRTASSARISTTDHRSRDAAGAARSADDVPLLAQHFLERTPLGRSGCPARAQAAIDSYAWPATSAAPARDRRAVILAKGDEIDPDDLPPEVTAPARAPGAGARASSR